MNERLGEVIRNLEYNECGLTGKLLSIELPPDDYYYLQEQAERAQELEKENQLLYGKLNNIRDEVNRELGG